MTRKKKRHRFKLWKTKTGRAVLVAAVLCVAVVVALSLTNSDRYPPISYMPRETTPISEIPGVAGDEFDRPGSKTDTGNQQDNSYNGTGDTAPQIQPGLSEKQKLELIESRYTIIFKNMETAYRRELNRMAASAMRDYTDIREGRVEMPVPHLVREYISAGRALEKEADRNFNTVLESMKEELSRNNLSMEPVDRAEKEYRELKSATRKEIFRKIAEQISG